MFIDFRERGRGRERERHIDVRKISTGCLLHSP